MSSFGEKHICKALWLQAIGIAAQTQPYKTGKWRTVMKTKNSYALKLTALLAIGIFGLSLICCGGGGSKPSSYTYDISGLALNEYGKLTGTIKVTNTDTGNPVSGVSVNLLYHTYHASGVHEATLYSISITGATNAHGMLLNIDELLPDTTPRKLVFSADDFNTYKELTLGTVPTASSSLFLTGPSSNSAYSLSGGYNQVNWSTANAICASHGGQLPEVSELQDLSSNLGFNPPGWPNTLPLFYWTQEEENPGYSHFAVDLNDGSIKGATQLVFDTSDCYVVCVPWSP